MTTFGFAAMENVAMTVVKKPQRGPSSLRSLGMSRGGKGHEEEA
jgi:hypothetical protein